MTRQLYKVLAEDGSAYHGGRGRWALPANGAPGAWMPRIAGPLEPCMRGYHLCRMASGTILCLYTPPQGS